MRDGSVDALVLGAAADMPDALGVLQELVALGRALRLHERGSTMASVRAWSMPYRAVSSWPISVRGPVLRHARTDQAVERQRGRPHQVGAVVVVGRLGQRAGGNFHQVCSRPSAKRSCGRACTGEVRYCSMTCT